MFDEEKIKEIARQTRINIIKMIFNAGSGHSGGSLSCVEILTILYDCYLEIDSDDLKKNDRNRFILSKGHAAPALYATLARKGFFDKKELFELRRFGSRLQGHPCMFKLPGVEISTGSLGMGISVGVGMALAAKQLKSSSQIYVLCGDGELQEGQNWEALMSANKWKLDNLTIIIDRNHVQLDGTENSIMPLGCLSEKINSFGANTLTCNGHDFLSLKSAFDKSKQADKTTVIIAETTKGKGVSFMEGQAVWHGKKIELEDYHRALEELNGGGHRGE